MPGWFVLRKNLHSTKCETKTRILVKESFGELCDSRLSGLYTNFMGHRSSKLFWRPLLRLICCRKKKTLEVPTPTEVAGEHTSMRNMALKVPLYWRITRYWRSLSVDTSKFGLLTIEWHNTTRKQLLLYLQNDRSGLIKPIKHKNHR